ncbi:MAG: hypothetical protein RIR26_160 [Pseudomonadota bacterium]
MLRRILASLSLTCACLAVSNAHADTTVASEALPTPSEIAHMAFQGEFLNWGIPSTESFCSDVDNIILIGQDLAYAYLLESGYVDSLLSPSEGAIVSQGQAQTKSKGQPMTQGQTQAQGQAQVKAKDIPVAQGQTQAQGQAQVKAKDIPTAQGQTQAQGQAQVKAKDVPAAQGQTQAQGQAQVKAKDIPTAQGQTQAQGQAQVKAKDLPTAQGQTQAQGQAQVKAKDVPVSQGQTQAQGQAQVKAKDIRTKQGKLLPAQQSHSQSMVARNDLDLRRFVDYSNALTEDEVRLVRENFDSEFLSDLEFHMRDMCGR